MSDRLEKAHKKLTDRVIDLPGVNAVAVGARNGEPCLKVFVEKGGLSAKGGIPSTVDGVPVHVETGGVFRGGG